MQKTKQIATNFQIDQSEWDSNMNVILFKDNDSSRSNYLCYVQNHIEYDKKCFNCIINRLSVSGDNFSVDTIVDELKKQSSEITLFSYMEKLIEKLLRQEQYRTSETYRSTLNSFKRFRNNIDVYFDDIVPELLISYEYYLRTKELSPNTISFYMKRLRAVYNNAVEDGYIDNKYPFRKVFTSSEKTVKRAIQLKYIRKLKELDLSYSSSRSFARDMFLFSFYTRGMSFVDIAYLQKKNLKDDVLTYRRKKTGQLLSIRWENCMRKIVDQYSSQTSPFMFPIIKDVSGDTRKQYHNALTLINRNLKEIGKDLGLTLPLTMYVARHSWASIARNEGIPLSVISEGMGHDSESTTQIYLASLETQVIDRANRKILKLL